MVGGTTARALFAALAAVLMALQVFFSMAGHTTAHRPPAVTTAVTTDAKVVTEAVTEGIPAAESASCGNSRHSESRISPFRATRDRCRPADSAPGDPSGPPLDRDPAVGSGPDTARPAAFRTTRSSASHSAAALQVFRC
ncbi:hypothetical protein [Streptomyces cavernae]|uniref:hypothetical protein n=1 Tax=Streptomyces cavernae TaxID=2259034 RepID=UPI000FEB9F62|nr:hypothetical protein [Streptomyces cavernae]